MKQEIYRTIFEKSYKGYQSFKENILTPVFGEISPLNKSFKSQLRNCEKDIFEDVVCFGQLDLAADGDQMQFFNVTLKPHVMLSRNKVTIQNFIRRELLPYSSALIVFHTLENPEEWRISFVSKGSNSADSTSAKRYTYLVGKHQSCRTASEQFEELSNKEKTLDNITDAFSVEKLSKSFFEDYKTHYVKFCDYIVSQPSIFQSIFDGDDKAVRDFSKKMLGRIVFLYFIQKKGWLGVPENKSWGEGDLNYLWKLFNYCEHKELFYSEYLCKLFFNTLNTPRANDIAEIIPGKKIKIPFLNGGLFEEDYPKYRSLIFQKELFSDLFQFFNQYNFTIYEDDPNDQTVAVDPEMLGHIFENLLEDNKDKGAYYTPKEIVHYMCQESLIEYLTTYFENKGYEVINYTSFDKPDQPELFPINEGRKGQLTIEATSGNTSKKIDRILIEKLLKQKIDDDDKEFLLKHAAEFNQALDKVKICDPAIGSGAFPMGLLKEIFNAKQTLHTYEYGNAMGFNASQVKLNIIQNSIYGVDIEKGAVDIARLRFWLSLVVDENVPKALPNLEYKIVVGDSLVSKFDNTIIEIDWNKKTIGVADELTKQMKHALLSISDTQRAFFESEDKEEKTKLKIEIRQLKLDVLINQLSLNKTAFHNINVKSPDVGFGLSPIDYKKNLEIDMKVAEFNNVLKKLRRLIDKPCEKFGHFDWKLDFPEIMNEQIVNKTGFDIVIGNPPYGAKLSTIDKEFIKIKYETAKTIRGVQKASLDTFTLFIEQGHNLTRLGGNLHYIVPISVTSSDSMTGVHRMIESDCSEIKVSSYSVRPQPVFENAVVNTSILYFKKDGKPCEKIYSTKMYRKNKNFNLKHLVDNLEFIDVIEHKIYGRYPKISLDIERKILSKIFAAKTNIGSLLKNKGKAIFYRTTGGRYYKVITNYTTGSTKEKVIYFDKDVANSIGAILSSNLYFWFYQIFSNNLDLKKYEIEVFGIPFSRLDSNIITKLENIYSTYLTDIEKNVNIRQTERYANINSFKEYKIGKSKHIIDQIDDIIGPLYGLTNEEIDFIKNYEIEFRLPDGY